jgi:hypothetical protein
MKVFEVAGKCLFDGVYVVAYICTLGAGSNVSSVLRREFECMFVVAADSG